MKFQTVKLDLEMAEEPEIKLPTSFGSSKKKGYEKSFEEIIVENFPNMEKAIVNQVQEAQRVPYRIKPRRNTPDQIRSDQLLSRVQLLATP